MSQGKIAKLRKLCKTATHYAFATLRGLSVVLHTKTSRPQVTNTRILKTNYASIYFTRGLLGNHTKFY